MAGLGRQIGRLEIMIERCLKATVGGEWGTKTRTLGMSFDNDSGLQWWLNSTVVEFSSTQQFSEKKPGPCTYRAASICPHA